MTLDLHSQRKEQGFIIYRSPSPGDFNKFFDTQAI